MNASRFRRLVAAYIAIYSIIRAPAFWSLRNLDPDRFVPVGVLSWLDAPIPAAGVIALWALTVTLAVIVAFGWMPRVVAPAWAIITLILFTYRSSWGQILWFENLPAIHALMTGLAAAALRPQADRHDQDDETGLWLLRLAAIATATTYVLAGIAKLRIGGLAWVTDSSLANHIAFSAARLEVLGGNGSPLAAALLSLGPVLTIGGAAAVLIELSAPLALVRQFRRFRTVWVIAAWTMHAAIAASMFVVFSYPLAFVAFAPLFAPDTKSDGEFL